MYQALYRKWRPRTFDEVVGQPHITETLKNQVRAGHLSHAYLFIGTRGTGKTTCARILTKAVNCENPQDGNPCCECRFCRGIDEGSLMDVVELDAASNNGVDNVRQLRDEAVFSPATAHRRVYIIDEVHMLSGSAFNALLKILEEPPAHLLFILATTELNKVPATILSRCQRHSFKRLDTASITERLEYVAAQENLNLTADAAALLAGLSEGGMRDALSMLDQCSGRETIDTETVYSALGLAGRRETGTLLHDIAEHDAAAAVTRFSALWQAGKDPAALLGELSALLRDILMCAVAPKGGQALCSGSYDEQLLQSFRGVFPIPTLIADIDCIQSALAALKTGQARTVCELCLITLCEPGLGDSLPMLRARVAALEERLEHGAVAEKPAKKPAPERPAEPHPQVELRPEPEPEPPPWDDAPPFDWEPPPEPAFSASQPEHFAPPVREENPTEATANIPAAAGGGIWETLRARAAEVFPIGLSAILNDPAQVGAVMQGDTLQLSVATPFARNMLDRPDVTAKLGALAAEITGTPVRVQVAERGAETPTGAPAQTADADNRLDALSKFSIVQFRD